MRLLSFTASALLPCLHLWWKFREILRDPSCDMPNYQCPVRGCGKWSKQWKGKAYSLPPADVFTLMLDEQLTLPSNTHICHECYRRHHDHDVSLDGRTQVAPLQSSYPLDVLLSAIEPSSSSFSSLSSSSSSSFPSSSSSSSSPSSS